MLQPRDLVRMGVSDIFQGWNVLYNKEQTSIKVCWVGYCNVLDNRELWQQSNLPCMDNSTNLIFGTMYTAQLCSVKEQTKITFLP